MAVRAARRVRGPSDAERWERALSAARGAPSSAALDGQRRRRRNFWVWFSALLVVALAAGVVLVLLLPSSGASGGGDDDGSRLLPEPWSLVAMGVGFALEATGFVLLVRAGQWGSLWRAPTAALTLAQRRGVLRQMRGRAPVVPEQLPVVLDLARRMQPMDRYVVLLAGLVILQVGNFHTEPWPFAVLLASSTVFFVVAAVLVLADRRRASRFIARHAPSGV